MKILKYVLVSFLTIIILGIIAGLLFIRYTSHKSLPDYNQDVVFSGLSEDVRVIRDEMAVPHIYAQNEEDLYKCIGYLQAQDRLWQMDLMRRLTTGRLSEIFGKEYVKADQLFRSLHFSQKSRMVLDSCDTNTRQALEAYAEGVNTYIEHNSGKLAPEFTILGYKPDKWEAVHSANLIGYMAWSLTMGWDTEVILYKISQIVDNERLNELVPDMDLQDVYIIPGNEIKEEMAFDSPFFEAEKAISDLGLQVFQASNNWVVAPEKSANGSSMLANDMHLELMAPGIWYQMHQVIPGSLDVTGVVLPGQPFVICGHNKDVAWGMTNVMLDDMDFYLEKINEKDSLKYMLDGSWKDIEVEKEIIYTKEGDTAVVFNQYTHRGPIISDIKKVNDKALSMKWIGNEYSNELRSVYLFNRMKNWDDFKDAAKTFISVSQNIAYADVNGNIGMYISAGVPIRKGEGVFIVPGDTSLYDWTGIVPFDELPHLYNPENGYIASANNRTVGDDYPYYISRWYDLPNRMERIVEGLESKEKLDVEDMKAIQSNQNSKWAEKLVPYFKSLLERRTEDLSEQEKNFTNSLFAWDYEMGAESIEASMFEQFYFEFISNVFEDEMGEDLFKQYLEQDMLAAYVMDGFRQKETSPWFDDISTEDVAETAEDIAVRSVKDAVSALSARLGDDMEKWQWGKIHSFTVMHPLGSIDVLDKAFKYNRGPFQVGGSYHTVSPYSYPMDSLFYPNHGASHRHIFVTGDWDKSQVIIPTGISGNPASKHYCDQTEKYIEYIYKTDAYTEQAVKTSGLYEMIFKKE